MRGRPTNRKVHESTLAILAAVLVLTACSPPGFTLSTGPQVTTITGRFGAEPRGDAGCAWIRTSTKQRIEVTYPNGWRIDFAPPALYDDAGNLRARAGDMLTIVGYFEDVGASGCQPQRSFVANEVSGPSSPASPS